MPQQALHVLVIGQDHRFRDALVEALEQEQLIGSVCAIGHDFQAHSVVPEPDVVLVDAGPPAPAAADVASLHTSRKEPLAVVLASDVNEATRELGEAVGAVAYVRKGSSVTSITPVVMLLA